VPCVPSLTITAIHTDRYPADKMRQLVEGLHKNGQHWIAITDAGVAADEGYAAYEDGEKEQVFIKSADGGSYLGQVGPGGSW